MEFLFAEKDADVQAVLTAASIMLRNKYGFSNTILQVEHFQDEMETCGPCQLLRSSTPSSGEKEIDL